MAEIQDIQTLADKFYAQGDKNISACLAIVAASARDGLLVDLIAWLALHEKYTSVSTQSSGR